jgi:protein-S-isoprenylcysteine O-methyltransferase Ste14
MFVDFTLGLWATFIAFWLIETRTNSQTRFSSEVLSLVKLVGSALVIYLPLLARGVLATRLFPSNVWSDASGTLVAAAGVFLAIRARSALGKNWSGKVMLQREHQLVTEGPYSLVRHPIYFGGLLAMLGSCLVLGQVFGFAYFGLSLLGLARKSRQEEALLAKQFPNEYPNYKQRVRMLLPYLYCEPPAHRGRRVSDKYRQHIVDIRASGSRQRCLHKVAVTTSGTDRASV